MYFDIDPELHKQFKLATIERGESMTDAIKKFINVYIEGARNKNRDKNPIL